LLKAINFSVTSPLTEADILGTWAGLRPLVKSATSGRTADLSRRHSVRGSASGVVSVTGGKLTTYREMAQDTVDAVVEGLGAAAPRGAKRCRTKKLPLVGAAGYDALVASAGADPLLRYLADRYGDEARTVAALVADDASLGEPLVAGLPYVRAEAVHAARHEMARSVDDVLSRRTRARLLARDASAAAADDVAALIAPVLGWTPAEAAASAEQYRALVEHERQAPGLPETAIDASLGG
jgi:glycerol-3-phosphate dehydrogenase